MERAKTSREKLIACIAGQYVLDPGLLDRESIPDTIRKTDKSGIGPQIEPSEVEGEILRIFCNSRSLTQRLQLTTTGRSKAGVVVVVGVRRADVAPLAHRQLKRKERQCVPPEKIPRKINKISHTPSKQPKRNQGNDKRGENEGKKKHQHDSRITSKDEEARKPKPGKIDFYFRSQNNGSKAVSSTRFDRDGIEKSSGLSFDGRRGKDRRFDAMTQKGDSSNSATEKNYQDNGMCVKQGSISVQDRKMQNQAEEWLTTRKTKKPLPCAEERQTKKASTCAEEWLTTRKTKMAPPCSKMGLTKQAPAKEEFVWEMAAHEIHLDKEGLDYLPKTKKGEIRKPSQELLNMPWVQNLRSSVKQVLELTPTGKRNLLGDKLNEYESLRFVVCCAASNSFVQGNASLKTSFQMPEGDELERMVSALHFLVDYPKPMLKKILTYKMCTGQMASRLRRTMRDKASVQQLLDRVGVRPLTAAKVTDPRLATQHNASSAVDANHPKDHGDVMTKHSAEHSNFNQTSSNSNAKTPDEDSRKRSSQIGQKEPDVTGTTMVKERHATCSKGWSLQAALVVGMAMVTYAALHRKPKIGETSS